MKILVVTDLHSQQKVLPVLENTFEQTQPDAVFCLGDLTVVGPSAAIYTEEFFFICNKNNRPVIYVSGNNDDPTTIEVMKQNGSLLDYQEQAIDTMRVIGLGYGPPSEPFTPNLRGAILLTHVPPWPKIVPASVTNVPAYHFAGHLHHFERIWRLGNTMVIQVPTAMNFRAVLFDLSGGSVAFIDLA